jgi:hypothetical protein
VVEITGLFASRGADQYLSGFLSSQRNRREPPNFFGVTRADPNLSALARRQNRTSLRHRMSGGLNLADRTKLFRMRSPSTKAAAEIMQLQLDVLNNVPAVAWTITPEGRCDFINRYYGLASTEIGA